MEPNGEYLGMAISIVLAIDVTGPFLGREIGAPSPNGELVDRAGQYVRDRAGNYILTVTAPRVS